MKKTMIAGTLAVLCAPADGQGGVGGSGAAETKSSPFCAKGYDEALESGVVDFVFGNGVKVEMDCDALPANIQRQLMLHGALQKVGDSYAGARGNYAEGIDKAKGVIGALQSGEWGTGRDGDSKPRLGELSEAIARVKSIDLAAATAAVEAADEEKRKNWRAHPKIKAAIALIRSEKAQKALEATADAGDIQL